MAEGRLAGRSAVVTGGARGIGAAIALAFAAEGARVVIFDVDGVAADATAEGVGQGCAARVVDVSDERAVDGAFDALAAEGFACDVPINNAAIQREARWRSSPSTTPAPSSTPICWALSCAAEPRCAA